MRRMECARRLGLLALVIGLGAPGLASAVTVTLETGDFSGWNSAVFKYATSNSANVTNSVVATGGNPGSYWHQNLSLFLAGGSLNRTAALVFNTDPLFEYDPSVDGPIDDVDFRIDVRIGSANTSSVAFDLVLRQGGEYYLAEIGTSSVWASTFGATDWETRSFSGLQESDFSLIDPTLPAPLNSVPSLIFSSMTPDFSGGGAPIRVGFFVQAQTPQLPIVREAWFDNFRVEFVPQPDAQGSAAAALLVIACLRRSRGPPAAGAARGYGSRRD